MAGSLTKNGWRKTEYPRNFSLAHSVMQKKKRKVPCLYCLDDLDKNLKVMGCKKMETGGPELRSLEEHGCGGHCYSRNIKE